MASAQLSASGDWNNVLDKLARSSQEIAAALYFDGKGASLGSRHFFSQQVTRVNVPIRPLVTDIVALDARAMLLVHNHPSGNVRPSKDDLRFTRHLFVTLEAIEVRLLDHIILSRNECLSFRAAHYL